MGSKNKHLIMLILLVPSLIHAQKGMNFTSIDSITYGYYLKGEWDKLIKSGNEALDSGIDYKFLRQRMGFASFAEKNYFESERHFEKALVFDSYNEFTLEYLYYSYLNTGKDDYAGVLIEKMDPAFRKKLSLSAFRIISAVDFEYSYQASGTVLRSDPQYFRAGLRSALGYRLNLYQSFSSYNQVITARNSSAQLKIRQADYYAGLNWNASEHLLLRSAYHLIRTNSGKNFFNGNLFLLGLSPAFNRFTFETYGSLLNINRNLTFQTGIQAGYVFPGRSDFYLKGMVSIVAQNGRSRFIYNPQAGLKLSEHIWVEGNSSIGNMNGYNDFNGLYVYNTYDPIILKTGSTLVYYMNRNISLWLNCSYEKKEFIENKSFRYNQFSYLGGIKWKL